MYPLPPLARIIPLTVATWNTLKGGGDTLTRLTDICQERIGVRSENLVACTRLLLNVGLVFHRCNQMCTSKDPSEYPTLLHSRCAANKRFSAKDSLKVLGDILLGWANDVGGEEELPPVELMNVCPSPAVRSTRRSARNSSTPEVRMPCVRAISGKTPGKGSNMRNLHPEFVERCVNCDGTFPSMKHDHFKKEQRMACSVCKRKTAQFCWKCRRHLCNEAPLKGKDRDEKKFPKKFSVKVPLLKGDGSLQRDSDGKPIFKTEYGVLSCYIIAHQEKWKSIYAEKRSEESAAVGESDGEGLGVIVEKGTES